MALMKCPECGNKISDKAEFCIQCGCPISSISELKVQHEQLKVQGKILKQQKKEFNSMAKCPRCGSTSLSGNKKGFGLMKGAIGVTFAGPVGILAAGIGKNKVKVTCIKCGKQFKA